MVPPATSYSRKFTTKEGLTIYVKQAKHVSYGATRPLANVTYAPVHYTGNAHDTAAGNANYFATSNTRQAGAQFFIDPNGIVFRSIQINQTAYAVGGFFTKKNGAGRYYKRCMNSNSVSIELCSYTMGYPTDAQMKSLALLLQYLKRKCPNLKTVLRHWDANGKDCPDPMVGAKNQKWKKLKKDMKARGVKGLKYA